jgi:hypothetical protein
VTARRIRARAQGVPPPGAVDSRRLLPDREVRDQHLACPDSQPAAPHHQPGVGPDNDAVSAGECLHTQVKRGPPSRQAYIVQQSRSAVRYRGAQRHCRGSQVWESVSSERAKRCQDRSGGASPSPIRHASRGQRVRGDHVYRYCHPLVAQAVIASGVWDPTLVSRAQRYEREALATLFDRSLDALYDLCLALTGDVTEAESVAAAALKRALDGLHNFEGDSPAFHVWLLRLAASTAARHRPPGVGIRGALTRLSHFDYELVTLRILGQVGVDHLAPALSAEPASLRAWLVSALRELDGRPGTGWGHDLRAFDGSISDVIGGTDVERAAARASAPPDAEALLRVVASVRALAGGTLPPAAAARLRTNVLAAAAERRALWVYRHHNTATVPGIEKRHYSSKAGTFIALSIACVLAVVVGSVLAMLSSFANPNSALYPLKLTGESTLVRVNMDRVNRAQLEIKLAQTREREAEDMAARGDGDLTVQALGRRYTLLRAAGSDLSSVQVHDARWKAARDRLFAESDVTETEIERELEATGQSRSKADLDRLATAYEADRKALQAQLAPQPTQPVVPATPPPPTPS